MRTKVEIERSKAEMERMADDALRGLARAKEMNATVLVKHFELWHERSKARAQILSWVLGQELHDDMPPQLPQANVMRGQSPEPLPDKAYCSECGMAVNSSHQQHYHWCSLAGNGA